MITVLLLLLTIQPVEANLNVKITLMNFGY